MNIEQLESYNLSDAVKFNSRLNPRLWDRTEHLKPEVREQLLRIAEDFAEFLGVENINIKDITLSGSNAAYTYTPHSDIDLHLVVDLPDADTSAVYRELFDAKKYQYNTLHNIRIGGYPVELYVQNANQAHHSQGIYSVLNNEWTDVPKRRKPAVDDVSTRSKYEDLDERIAQAVESDDLKQIVALIKKIKDMRQAGLDEHGEFGPENLAFKMLRSQGRIKQLFDARNRAKDRELSLREQPVKPHVTYGFKEDAGLTWDGVDPTTCMFANEAENNSPTDEEILHDFIDFCVAELKINKLPIVKLRKDPQWPAVNRTFGRYTNDRNMLEVAWGQRHIMDVLRTVAHELTHRHQHERDGEEMDHTAGETGSKWVNEANARAGILMRDYGRLHPEYFAAGAVEDLDEANWKKAAAGLAATAALAGGAPHADAQSIGPFIGAGATVGRALTTYKGVNWPAMVQGETNTALNNYIRAHGNDPHAQNLSGLYQWERQMMADPKWSSRTADYEPQYQNPPADYRPDYTPVTYGQGRPLPGYTQQNESASGYIPTKRQAKDPRYSMALTQDIKPGQVGKEANKLALNTNSQGKPQELRPDGLVERMMEELELFKKKTVAENKTVAYLDQIPKLKWVPVTRSVWDTIQDEGLDEEQNAPNHNDWVMAKLSISHKDATALQAFANQAIEEFNSFDIQLKSRYPGLTDLIDYDRGIVTIVKPTHLNENFADGKIKGKSRPGRVKRAGASCAGSVTDLRQKAKNSSGEQAKMYHWCANMKSGKKKVNEIDRLPKSDAGDWGGKDTLAQPETPVKTKPLPGGSKYSYAVNRPTAETLEIMIFDGDALAAEMDLYYTQDFMKTWKVDTVVVDPDYRGQGLGKALYGIALSILKLPVEAGESQTRSGQQMWLMLNSIPGVEVVGYNMVPTKDYQAHKGDKIVDQNKDWTRYIFPVAAGKQSMRSGRPGTGLYTSRATMIAQWKGQSLTEETAREVLGYAKAIHKNGDFNLDYAIMAYPEWEQRNVPVDKLLLPTDDNMDLDPYLRINAIDWEHVNRLTSSEILERPIIVDPQGWVIDGNHRARAAMRLGLKSIPAFVITYPAEGFR